jgi:hypothetical protein
MTQPLESDAAVALNLAQPFPKYRIDPREKVRLVTKERQV